MIFFDTETCGLHGLPVLIQWAIGEHEVVLHDVWLQPVSSTLDLIELFVNHKEGVCGFNLAFDWFQLAKTYTVFSLVDDKSKKPIDIIDEIANKEPLGIDGPCVKPITALDLMLVAKKGKYQSTMERTDVAIRKVPVQMSTLLAKHLNDNLNVKPIYFARRSNPTRPWSVRQHKDKNTGQVDMDFNDVVLEFAPSGALKTLYADMYNLPFDQVVKFQDVELPKAVMPEELGYMPYAKAIESGPRWRKAWPSVISIHVDHWRNNFEARQYAEDDVIYTRKIYEGLGRPPAGDDDSILACAVAVNRWRGFAVDVDALTKVRDEAASKLSKTPIAGKAVRDYILGELDEQELIACKRSTKKQILAKMKDWQKVCPECEELTEANPNCVTCNGKGTIKHPVADKAKAVNDARAASKEIELLNKLIRAKRFHASLKVIGALSGRMSGADGLNPQGINRTRKVRACFPLADKGLVLTGGDFESFEVVIAVASYKDPKLEADLNTFGICPDCLGKKIVKEKICQGCDGKGETRKKIHGIFGSVLYNKSYDEIVLTKGTENDLYSASKQGVFSQMYGGNEFTLMDRLGLEEEDAVNGTNRWHTRYQGVARAQRETTLMFQSMRQAGGIGSKIYWNEPAEKIESLLGFPRYFTLENEVCRQLFNLAESPPKEWTNIKLKVVRRDRVQTACGSVRSALFGAAFNIQSGNTRAAINHVIQSTGAQITKHTQRKIWDIQPHGINEWSVMVLNIHDEIMAPCKPELKNVVHSVVRDVVESYRGIIPLISIDWSDELKTWADK